MNKFQTGEVFVPRQDERVSPWETSPVLQAVIAQLNCHSSKICGVFVHYLSQISKP